MVNSVEKQLMINIIKAQDKKLKNENSLYKSYLFPDIPDKVVKKLIKNFDNHLPAQSVVGYYDDGPLSTGKSGIVFTVDGFYSKFMGKPIYLHYSSIDKMELRSDYLYIKLKNDDENEYIIYNTINRSVLQEILIQLIEVDKEHGQSSIKSSGIIKKIDLPEEMMASCEKIIHSASILCGSVGTGLAQIPCSDNAVILPIQVTMIVSLGKVFELDITEAGAKGIIGSAGTSYVGRNVSQLLLGWIPGLGNVINTATAAGLTEAVGWIAVKHFYDRWIGDKNKGRFEGMKDGYAEASGEYERKLRKQAEEFLNQMKDVNKEREEYNKLLLEYEEYIKELERKNAAYEIILEMKDIYNGLVELKTA